MNHMLQIKLLFMLGLILTLGIDSQTTLPSSIMDRAVADLGDRLSISLHEAGVKRVVVLDLLGAQKEIHPVGTWLADQLSSALQRNSANLEVVDRSKARGPTETDENSPENGAPGKKEIDIARSVGADAVIRGSYAKIGQRLGITLNIANVSRSRPFIPSVRGAVPISEEINGLSADPIPFFNGGVFRAGIGGITSPVCICCPQPEYSDKARIEKYQGTVVLDIAVTAEGSVEKLIVVKGPGLGLEENALKAVKHWKLRPATDVDDKPVTARVKIEVTFHLYTRRP
jgi:TonB family protein